MIVREYFQIDVELAPKVPVEEAPREPTTPRSFAVAELLTVGVAAHSAIPCSPPPGPTTAEHLAACLAADDSFLIGLGSRLPIPYSHPNAECAFQAQHVRCPSLYNPHSNHCCSANDVADRETNLFDGTAMRGSWSGRLHEWCEGHYAGLGRLTFCWTMPYFLVGLCNLHAGICSKHMC